MSWFKVDDKFHSHRKALRARRSHPTKRRDASALGLWVLAGSWSDDGFVPLDVLDDWDDDARDLAERLVSAGLWTHGEKAGERGVWFHDWQDMNPADKLSVKGTEGNHLRWHVNRGVVAPDCPLCSPLVAPDSGGESGAISPEDRGESQPESPDPSRPDHKNTITSAVADGEFEQWWELYPRKVGKGQARKAYTTARKKTDAATLLDGLREFVGVCQRSRTEPQFIAHADTWLNGERWADELPPTPGADGWEGSNGLSGLFSRNGLPIEEDWGA